MPVSELHSHIHYYVGKGGYQQHKEEGHNGYDHPVLGQYLHIVFGNLDGRGLFLADKVINGHAEDVGYLA